MLKVIPRPGILRWLRGRSYTFSCSLGSDSCDPDSLWFFESAVARGCEVCHKLKPPVVRRLILTPALFACLVWVSSAHGDVGYFDRPRYIGSVYCYACHSDISREFAKTKMGRLFQLKPQNDIERLGCEGCHGPGSNHAAVGGGIGVGGLIEFRLDRGQSVVTANRACLNCHDEAFWHGSTKGAQRLACYDCHLVMTRMSRTAQLAPPYVDPWNNRRTWSGAAVAGTLAGILSGVIFRRRRFSKGRNAR
jgi:hypothetical protein